MSTQHRKQGTCEQPPLGGGPGPAQTPEGPDAVQGCKAGVRHQNQRPHACTWSKIAPKPGPNKQRKEPDRQCTRNRL
eukprot:11752398-Alexandrium_andersonii.AAC.1